MSFTPSLTFIPSYIRAFWWTSWLVFPLVQYHTAERIVTYDIEDFLPFFSILISDSVFCCFFLLPSFHTFLDLPLADSSRYPPPIDFQEKSAVSFSCQKGAVFF